MCRLLTHLAMGHPWELFPSLPVNTTFSILTASPFSPYLRRGGGGGGENQGLLENRQYRLLSSSSSLLLLFVYRFVYPK